MFEYDLPEDANPAQVYGTVEFQKVRMSRVPVPVRKATADNFEALTPAQAKERFMAIYRRKHPAPAPVPAARVRPAVEKMKAAPPPPPPVVAPNPIPVVIEPPTSLEPVTIPDFWFKPPEEQTTAAEVARQRDWLIIDLRPKCEQIIRTAAAYFDVTRNDILSQRRQASIVYPRQIAMYLAKTLTLRSLPEIGRRFGGRDHTTVLHAVRKIEGMVAAGDEVITADIAALTARLGVHPEVRA